MLDPEQNHTFNDHYLEVDYDLSEVMFICTANSMNIPGPLLDRMEVIRSPATPKTRRSDCRKISGAQAAQRQRSKRSELEITEDALKDTIRYYTREAGVRGLDRDIAKICRKTVTSHVREKAMPKTW